MEEMAWTSHHTEVSNDNLWYVNNYGTLIFCFSFLQLLSLKNPSLSFTVHSVTVQYLHSYDAKSIPNRLRRWDFA